MYRKNDLYRQICKVKANAKLKITFDEKDTFSPFYLVTMAKANIITLDKDLINKIDSIKNTSSWDLIPNRIIEVTVTKLFNPTWFSENMIKASQVEIITG